MSPRPRPLPARAYLGCVVLVTMLACNASPRDAEPSAPAAVPTGIAGAAGMVTQQDPQNATVDPNAADASAEKPAKAPPKKKAETAGTWKLGNKVWSDDCLAPL